MELVPAGRDPDGTNHAFIVLLTSIHVTAHFLNYRYIQDITIADTTWLALVSGPALTGQVATLALFWMVTSAAEPVAKKKFEIFWYAHHLYIFLFAFLTVHSVL